MEKTEKTVKKEAKVPVKKVKTIKVKALFAVNLGKIEREGSVIHFAEGETKEIKDDAAHRRVADMYIEGGFLEIVKE